MTQPEFWTDRMSVLYRQYLKGIRTPETRESNRIRQRLYRRGYFKPCQPRP